MVRPCRLLTLREKATLVYIETMSSMSEKATMVYVETTSSMSEKATTVYVETTNSMSEKAITVYIETTCSMFDTVQAPSSEIYGLASILPTCPGARAPAGEPTVLVHGAR